MKERIISGAARVYLFFAIAFIVLNYISIWYFHGFWELAEIVSPFNITNLIVVAITLAPGILLMQWSERLREKAKNTTEGSNKSD